MYNLSHKMILHVFLFSLIITSQNAFAKGESWYLFSSLGYAHLVYPSQITKAIDEIEALDAVNSIRANMDVLGFYWTMQDNKTILGTVTNTVFDYYTKDTSSFIGFQFTFSFSGMHFFDTEVGKGLFIRSDLGMAANQIESTFQTNTTIRIPKEKNIGGGFLLGGGYGIQVAEDTHVLISLNYAFRRIDEKNYYSYNLTVGGLF